MENTPEHSSRQPIRLLFLADTHLGFDAPLRPKVQRRRRGEDFYRSYLTALQPAFDRRVDLVLHGGDMFFRSRIHSTLVEAAFEPLLKIVELGIPVFIIPGNHERSNIPRSLLENHPSIIIFDHPQTYVFSVRGSRLALVGFANIRHNPGFYFKHRLKETGWETREADIRLLCMHQAVEGAQVGVQNYTFQIGPEVIRGCDIPPGFHAVLSGHIHRHQILTNDLDGRRLHAPVFYPGSTERTSFAEREEKKGYIMMSLSVGQNKRINYQFVPIETRPMIDLIVKSQELSLPQIKEWLVQQIASLDENAIVRIQNDERDAALLINTLNDRWLRSIAPKSMNISWARRWHPSKKDSAI